MIGRWRWPLLGLGLLGVGASSWWGLHRGVATVQAAVRTPASRSRARAQAKALGARGTPVPATCCGGITTVTPPTATTRRPGTTTAYHVTSVNDQRVSWPGPGVTVLYFMSAECGSCIQGEQQLAALQATLPTTVQVVSLDVTPQVDTPQMVTAMARETGARWPQAFATSALLTAYHVAALDQIAVVTATGRVVYDGGLPSNAHLRQLIQQANA